MTSVNKLESIQQQKRGLKWILGHKYSRSTISYSSNYHMYLIFYQLNLDLISVICKCFSPLYMVIHVLSCLSM